MNITRSFLVSAVAGAVLAGLLLQGCDSLSGGAWQTWFKDGLGDAKVVSGTASYKVDNYWCRDCKETVEFFARVKKPWIAYKVLAAGAIPAREGFRYAFESGADFALVGMFDFQIDVDVSITRQVLAAKLNRSRAWMV